MREADDLVCNDKVKSAGDFSSVVTGKYWSNFPLMPTPLNENFCLKTELQRSLLLVPSRVLLDRSQDMIEHCIT